MKTIEQFYGKVKADKVLQKALRTATEGGTLEAFLKEQQVDVTEEELEALRKANGGELSDDELDVVAGGSSTSSKGGTSPYRRDSRGNVTHWRFNDTFWGTYKIYHYVCEMCGRTLHKGSWGMYFCDPCDTWYAKPTMVIDEEGRL